MTKDEFLVQMQDVLQTETELTPDTVLMDLEEWDSLSIMATMAFVDKTFGIKLKMADFKTIDKVKDLMDLVSV